MPKRKARKVVHEYTFLAIKITGYQACIGAGINYQVTDKRHHYDEAKVYLFDSRLEITGSCTYPEKRVGEEYSVTVFGDERRARQFAMTLADCHARDEDRVPVYRKVRGKQIPVYNIPKNIGMLRRQRGSKNWMGWLWVPPHTVTDMLALLPNVQPLYLDIKEYREGRDYWIADFSLQTNDPAEE